MKAFNRMTSIITTLALSASLPVIPASAKSVDKFSVSYKTLSESIYTESGDYIPAGSTAVTMKISGNRGFTNDSFLLNITEGYEVIKGDDDRPIIDLSNNLSSFIAAASADNGKLCVAVASTQTCCSDGSLFTFYCSSTSIATNVPATVCEMSSPNSDMNVNEGASSPRTNIHRIRFGDVYNNNNDGNINSVDAYYVLVAIENAGGNCYFPSFVYHFPWLLSTYYPSCYMDNPYCYIAADVLSTPNQLRCVDEDDAQEILYYAACVGTGTTYPGSGWFGDHLFDIDSLN